MELSFLQDFVVLAETQKFSAAAQKLHISQSTLSRHIQALEAELGCVLFHRTTRDMELSAYGTLYLPYARKILHTANTAELRLRDYSASQEKTVQIGVVHNPDLYQVSECLMAFQSAFPDLSVSVTEGTVSDLAAELTAGRLKLITMVCAQWEQTPENFVFAGERRLCAVLPRVHPLASADTISLSQLNGENLILPEKNNVLYQYLTHVLNELHVHPNIIYHGSSSGASVPLHSGMGIMIQDEAIAALHLDSDVVQCKLEPCVSYTFGLAYGEELSTAEKTFVRFTKQRYQECASKIETSNK